MIGVRALITAPPVPKRPRLGDAYVYPRSYGYSRIEASILYDMDRHPDEEWFKDPRSRWCAARHRVYLPGGASNWTMDVATYASITINRLIDKGYLVVVSWDDRARPNTVKRSDKPGVDRREWMALP